MLHTRLSDSAVRKQLCEMAEIGSLDAEAIYLTEEAYKFTAVIIKCSKASLNMPDFTFVCRMARNSMIETVTGLRKVDSPSNKKPVSMAHIT